MSEPEKTYRIDVTLTRTDREPFIMESPFRSFSVELDDRDPCEEFEVIRTFVEGFRRLKVVP